MVWVARFLLGLTKLSTQDGSSVVAFGDQRRATNVLRYSGRRGVYEKKR